MTAVSNYNACSQDAEFAPCFGYAKNTARGTTFVVSVFIDAIIAEVGRILGRLPIWLLPNDK